MVQVSKTCSHSVILWGGGRNFKKWNLIEGFRKINCVTPISFSCSSHDVRSFGLSNALYREMLPQHRLKSRLQLLTLWLQNKSDFFFFQVCYLGNNLYGNKNQTEIIINLVTNCYCMYYYGYIAVLACHVSLTNYYELSGTSKIVGARSQEIPVKLPSGLLPLWIHRNCGCLHKTSRRSSQPTSYRGMRRGSHEHTNYSQYYS